MPTSLNEERLLEVLAASGAAMATQARRAGLDATVPTCPDWRVAELVAHTTLVHRWAAGNLQQRPFERTDEAIIADEADLIGYFDAGVDELLTALQTVADDVEALVFLKDPPATVRHFWARRQAHETTIHGVDALSAALGRIPSTDEAMAAFAIDPDVALDGVDELLTGFFTRGRSKLALDEPFTVLVQPTDADRWWLVSVADGRLTTAPGTGPAPDADSVLRGRAALLYLGLWNRGDEIEETGDAGLLDRWRAAQRVSWS